MKAKTQAYGSKVQRNNLSMSVFGGKMESVAMMFGAVFVTAVVVFALALVASSAGFAVLFATALAMSALSALPFVVVKSVVSVMEMK